MAAEAIAADVVSAASEADLGEAAFAAGDADAGSAHFRRAIELEPARFDRRLVLARRLAAAGNADEAVSEIETVARDGGTILSVLAQAGSTAAAIGRHDISARLLGEAVAAAGPKAPVIWRMGIVNQLDRLLESVGELEAQLANRTEAERVLSEGLDQAAESDRQALEQRLSAVRLQARRAQALDAARQAEAAFGAQEMSAAVAHQRRSLELEPGRFDRRLRLARFLAAAGEDEAAVAEVEATARDGREILSVLAQAGAMAGSVGRPDLAASLFGEAVRSSTTRAPVAWRVNWAVQLERLAAKEQNIEEQLARRAEAAAVLETDGYDGEDRAALETKREQISLGLARNLGEAGRIQDASAEIDRIVRRNGVPAATLVRAAGVESALDRPEHACALYARAVEEGGSEAPAEWSALWANQLDRLAARAPGLAAFIDNRRRAEAVIRAARDRVPAEERHRTLLTLRLANVLWQLDDPDLATLAHEVTGAPVVEAGAREAALLAPFFKEVISPLVLRNWLADAFDKHSHEGALLTSLARSSLGDINALESLWAPLLEEEKRWGEGAAELVGLVAYDLGRLEIAHDRLSVAAARNGDFELWWKAGEAALRLGQDAAAREAFTRAGPRISLGTLDEASLGLTDLLEAVNRNYLHADRVDHAGLAEILAGPSERSGDFQPDSPAVLFEAALALDSVRRIPFRMQGEIPRRHGYVAAYGWQYGVLDAKAYEIVADSLLRCVESLLSKAADAVLEGQAPGGLQLIRNLPARLADVRLEMDRPEAARSMLQAMRAAGVVGERIDFALERCDLHEGKMDSASLRWAARGASVHPTIYGDEWVRREGDGTVASLVEPLLSGEVERVNSIGETESFVHEVMPFTMEVVKGRDLELRSDELLIGKRGALWRPPDWHVRAGDYPAEFGLALNAAAGAAVLPKRETEIVEEPVLVLAGADPISRPNYYHWIVHQLSRAAWAKTAGWLEGRRLMVPESSRTWMFEGLDLAGVDDAARRLQPAGRDLLLRDAWLVSAFEYPGSNLAGNLRAAMWGGAGVNPDEAPERLVFLGRPHGARRPVFDFDRLRSVVAAAGFDWVDPGELGVADQVRLLAQARGIAGFGGAAATNLLFARPGVRFLDLTNETTHWPEFSGLAIALGIGYRYLSGALPDCSASIRHFELAPTSYDLVALARGLEWVKTGAVAARARN